MLPNNNQPLPTATAVPINGQQGNVYTAQPVTQAYYGQPGQQNYPGSQQQPQVVYAQAVPVQPVEPVRIQVQQQGPVQTIVTYERYCGPITVLMGLILFFFIGPFAVFVVFCPCDEAPRRTVIRQ